jgi:multidrug efflux system membrane fusion protein
VRSDQASIDNAKAILAYTDILAPIAGRTGLRLVDEGNIVRASDTTGIVMITQMRPITVLFNLPQQDLPDINRGLNEGPLPIDAIATDGNSTADKGKVLVVDNQVDQTTGTVRLKAEFPNDNLQLWPGQFVNVRLLIDTLRKVVVVPTAAVQRGPNGTFVYIVKDDKTVTVRPITVGQQDDLQAVVATGLTAGEQVVTTGFARLAQGTPVVVTNAEEAGQIPTGSRPDRPQRGGRGQKGNDKGGGQKKDAAPVAGGGTPNTTAGDTTAGGTTGAAP